MSEGLEWCSACSATRLVDESINADVPVDGARRQLDEHHAPLLDELQ